MTRVTQKKKIEKSRHFSGCVTPAPFMSGISLISMIIVVVFNRQSMKQTKVSLYNYIILNFSLADRTSNWEEIVVKIQVSSVKTKVQQLVVTQMIQRTKSAK